MLWNLDVNWLIITVAVVTMLSFLLGYGIHGLVGNDGFGAYGNGFIISGGFFTTIYLVNWYGIRLDDLTLAVLIGLVGSFVCLVSLTLVKMALARI